MDVTLLIILLGAAAAGIAQGVSGFAYSLVALSIGLVVDDAIVVLENVERHMRAEHVDAREARRRP